MFSHSVNHFHDLEEPQNKARISRHGVGFLGSSFFFFPMRVHSHIHSYTCTHAYTHNTHTHTHVCTYMYVHTHTHKHTRDIHMHTCTHSQPWRVSWWSHTPHSYASEPECSLSEPPLPTNGPRQRQNDPNTADRNGKFVHTCTCMHQDGSGLSRCQDS